jgi:hypothetical protein
MGPLLRVSQSPEYLFRPLYRLLWLLIFRDPLSFPPDPPSSDAVSSSMSPNSAWKLRTGAEGTLLGPMTTAWSPPASCSVHVVNCATCLDGYQAQHCVNGGTAQDYTGCWPPATRQAGSPKYPYLGWGFYSPGVACPTGYTAACTAEYGKRADWPIQFVLVAGETAIGCCPECV